MSATDLIALNPDCSKFVKEWTGSGHKFLITMDGTRPVLDALGESIQSNLSGYDPRTLTNLSPAVQAMIPDGVIARTPKLVWDGKADFAQLEIVCEEGLQETSPGAGTSSIGPNMTDEQAFGTNAGLAVPADTTFRFVFEPNDVALGYGLPFRAGYKWDMTIQAPNLTFAIDTNTVAAINNAASGNVPVPSSATITDILKNLGYIPTNISLLGVANVWEGGAMTEQYRAALFQYLWNSSSGGGVGSQEYVRRILRGETSYRFWIPHITVVRRYRTAPGFPGDFPVPNEIAHFNELGGPPQWTSAPDAIIAPGAGVDPKLRFNYVSTGPQFDFSGEFWVAEIQWSGYVTVDSDLYGNPLTGSVTPT